VIKSQESRADGQGGMAEPVTRYATGSGAHIAYQVLGHGPALVIVPGFASHLEVEWEDGACRSFIRRLAAFATVVRFDKRGTGLSDPVQELPTLQERDADLAAMIAAAGSPGHLRLDRPLGAMDSRPDGAPLRRPLRQLRRACARGPTDGGVARRQRRLAWRPGRLPGAELPRAPGTALRLRPHGRHLRAAQ
jgi:hypothetical protein